MVLGFFHPYCNSGGGGERVLWCAIKAIDEMSVELKKTFSIVIYTGDIEEKEKIIEKVKNVFGIEFSKNLKIEFVKLKKRNLIEDKSYRHFTILFQSIGSMFLALEGLRQVTPDIFIDTTGLAFSYPIAKYICDCKVISYTHYPTITEEMVGLVKEQKVNYNNNPIIANSPTLTRMKVIYYKLFSFIYRICGNCSDLTFVNGSWTESHIKKLWKLPSNSILSYFFIIILLF